MIKTTKNGSALFSKEPRYLPGHTWFVIVYLPPLMFVIQMVWLNLNQQTSLEVHHPAPTFTLPEGQLTLTTRSVAWSPFRWFGGHRIHI